jgi:hypothetical protein
MFDFRRRPTELWVWMALAAGASAQDASQPLPMDWNRSGAVLVDQSHFLDGPAGRDGFIGMRGEHLVKPDGFRFRIWGVNMAGPACFPDRDGAVRIANDLARLGVNCVRFHGLDSNWGRSAIDYAGIDTMFALLSGALCDRTRRTRSSSGCVATKRRSARSTRQALTAVFRCDTPRASRSITPPVVPHAAGHDRPMREHRPPLASGPPDARAMGYGTDGHRAGVRHCPPPGTGPSRCHRRDAAEPHWQTPCRSADGGSRGRDLDTGTRKTCRHLVPAGTGTTGRTLNTAPRFVRVAVVGWALRSNSIPNTCHFPACAL